MWLCNHRAWIPLGAVLAVACLAAAVAQDAPEPSSASATETALQASGQKPATNWRVLVNTVTLGVSVAVVGLALGSVLAVVLTRTDLPGRPAAVAVVVFLLFLPLYLHLAGWEAVFGKLGWFTKLTEEIVARQELRQGPDDQRIPQPILSGMRAVIFIHAIAAVPWAALVMSIGLVLVRREEEEAALLETSGANVIARVVMPQLAPFLAAAALLLEITAAGEMTVTNIYLIEPGNYTLAEQAYMTLQSLPLDEAAWDLLPSILVTALLVTGGVLAARLLAPLAGHVTEDRFQPVIYRLGRWKAPTAIITWLVLALLAGLPLLSMAYKAGTDVISIGGKPAQTWSALKCLAMPWSSLWRSAGELRWTMLIAAAAATLAVVAAIFLAEFSRRGNWKTWPVVLVVTVAWAVPGPIVGLGIAVLFNQNVFMLGWLYDHTIVPAIVAQSIRAAPVVLLTVWQAIERFPTGPIEAAQLDGAGRWTILIRIVLPQRKGALLAAWLAGMAIAAGDLAWSNFVLPAGYDTLQRRMFGDIHTGADDRVAGVCLAVSALYAVAIVLAALTYHTMSRRSSRNEQKGGV